MPRAAPVADARRPRSAMKALDRIVRALAALGVALAAIATASRRCS